MIEHKTWKSFIDYETKKPYFREIKDRLLSDNACGKIILPEPKNFFKAFDLCEMQKVKVVIIGQDPYHTLGVPNGLAFSVNRNSKLPPSLVNIFKELEADLGIKNSTGDLTSWSKQGVLLLNTSLSVCAGLPASHSKIGWELFTNTVINVIQQKKNIVFLLWGKHAQKKGDLIENSNFILEAAHPSPLSANNGFFGCGHFSKTNNFLTSLGSDPIDWQLE
ncbi:MAG: uracil-DNA glycosylase [Gammaproteobacteria bacterium]|nr:uracil-DNA glycosylase [Gammaproteobacteria bacterium]|tara:strand:+ start:2386 stop:3045 length:660 start_codon:yes stop_codon:yes gene_type:complete